MVFIDKLINFTSRVNKILSESASRKLKISVTIYTYIHTYIHTHKDTYINTNIRTYYIYISCTHTYIYIHM